MALNVGKAHHETTGFADWVSGTVDTGRGILVCPYCCPYFAETDALVHTVRTCTHFITETVCVLCTLTHSW